MRRVEQAIETVQAVVSAAIHVDPKAPTRFDRENPQLALG